MYSEKQEKELNEKIKQLEIENKALRNEGHNDNNELLNILPCNYSYQLRY